MSKLSERGTKIMDIARETGTGKQTQLESALQTGGQIVGGIGDIVGTAIIE